MFAPANLLAFKLRWKFSKHAFPGTNKQEQRNHNVFFIKSQCTSLSPFSPCKNRSLQSTYDMCNPHLTPSSSESSTSNQVISQKFHGSWKECVNDKLADRQLEFRNVMVHSIKKSFLIRVQCHCENLGKVLFAARVSFVSCHLKGSRDWCNPWTTFESLVLGIYWVSIQDNSAVIYMDTL